MGKVTREGTAQAHPSTIWRTCFAPMRWETWDPDVERLENVETNSHGTGLFNGNTFTFVMKTGTSIPTTVSDVVENESLVFSGSLLGGLVGFQGRIDMTPTDTTGDDGGAPTTHIKYSFGMNGFLGGVLGWVKSGEVVNGTEQGLANIIKMSEEAERNGPQE